MTKSLPFTQASIRRAVEAAKKCGLRVTGIRADGTVVVDDGDNSDDSIPIVAPDAQGAPPPSKWRD